MADTSKYARGAQLQLPVPKPDNGRTIAQVRRMGCWHPSECDEWRNEPSFPRMVGLLHHCSFSCVRFLLIHADAG